MSRTAIFGIATSALLVALVLVGCSEPLPEAAKPKPGATPSCEGDQLFACAKRSTLAPAVPAEPTKATGEPIRLGMINQENTAAGSYPELSQAAQAGIDFINEQLGGVHGRPLELTVCNTEFSAEGSTACGQQFVEAKAPAVLGGIDVFGNGVDVLEDNDIPYIGGIPVSTPSVVDANSFQWSGGTWGATVGFAWYAAHQLKAKKVSILYGEFGSITDSAEVGKQVLEDAGVDVQLVPYPIMATDISSALNAAATSEPDAIFVLAADTGCKAGFDGIANLALDVQAFYVGACAAPPIVEEAGTAKTDGAIFNVEGPIGADPPDPDFMLYRGVIEQYGKGMDPIGAGTVSFRSLMNLYLVLDGIDGDLTPAAIIKALKAQVDAPSFSGHPYTCDGEQFPGLPAMCSPQQILGQMDDQQLHQLGTWIDVGAVAEEAGAVAFAEGP